MCFHREQKKLQICQLRIRTLTKENGVSSVILHLLYSPGHTLVASSFLVLFKNCVRDDCMIVTILSNFFVLFLFAKLLARLDCILSLLFYREKKNCSMFLLLHMSYDVILFSLKLFMLMF